MGCCEKRRPEFTKFEREMMTIIYRTRNENIIRLFGEKFVKNNKKICKIEINGKEKELIEFYPLDNICNLFQ